MKVNEFITEATADRYLLSCNVFLKWEPSAFCQWAVQGFM